jgi:hypothetical protein
MDEEGIRSSDNNERIHKISAVPSTALVEDLATVRCFSDFHEIGVEPRYRR